MRARQLGIALLGLLLCSCLDIGVGVAPPTNFPSAPAAEPHEPDEPDVPDATPEPSPGRTATPRPSASPQPPPPPPSRSPTASPDAGTPFDLVIASIELDNLDDSVITGSAAIPVVDAAALAAVQEASGILELYLDRVFLHPSSRFTAAPADDLLTLSALSRLTSEAKAGLGAVDLDVRVSRAGPASANARVALQGDVVLYVSLDFQARLNVRLDDGRTGPLEQVGTLVFVPTPAGSRADFAEVRMLLPWDASAGAGANDTDRDAPGAGNPDAAHVDAGQPASDVAAHATTAGTAGRKAAA